MNNVNLLKQVLKKGCGRVGVSLHSLRLLGCFHLTDVLQHGGRSPQSPRGNPEPTLRPSEQTCFKHIPERVRARGAERCLHPTLPRGQQTCPRAEEGGHTRRSLWALPGEAAKARLRGEQFEGLLPLPVSLSQMLLSLVLPARGMPCCSHVPPASPADVWDPGRKPGRKHLPALRLSTRPRPPPTRASGLLAPPHFYRSPVSL